MNIRIICLGFMFFWLGIIWFVSSLPARVLPRLDVLNFDKMIHVLVYFILSSITFYNYRKNYIKGMNVNQILIFMVILASFEEAHQYVIPNRSVSILDLISNLIGIFSGWKVIIQKRSTNDFDS